MDALSPEEQRFLMVKSLGGRADDVASPETFLVLNWIEELKRTGAGALIVEARF